MTVVSAPYPPYSNPPIEPQFYQPSQFYISGVTLGTTTTVTTVANMNYALGQEVRLIIQPSNGCRQLNGVTGYVISIPSANSVVLSIDSSVGVDAYKSSSAPTQSQIVAIGDINSGFISTTGNVNSIINLPGAFINIS